MPFRKLRKQFAALPYRTAPDGQLNVLVVTSRDTGRWVIPKGWPMKNRRPHRAAAIEAFEEAGAVGRVAKAPIGTYRYEKAQDGGAVLCEVTVFPLAVEQLEKRWPERGERRREWVSPEEAAARVDEPELKAILLAFAPVG